ncbi:MAG: CHAT domain-containing protein [Gemmatimonadaceae bacterium]
MSVTPLFLVVAGILAQSSDGADRVRARAREAGGDALVTEALERPDEIRAALTRSLALAAGSASDSARSVHLDAAERLARAYAAAWNDAFLVGQVARFRRWSPDERVAKVKVDSLRRVGNGVLGRAGPRPAIRLWRESLRGARVLGDSAGEAAALGNIGAGFYAAGELDSAAAYLARSQALAQAIGDARTAGNAMGTLASVSKDRGELRRAEELYRQSLIMRQRSGDARGTAVDQNNLGLIVQTLGDLAGARRAFEAALALNRRSGSEDLAATNIVNLANIASLEGDYTRAAALYGEALTIYRGRGERLEVSFVLRNVGLLELRRGDYPAARVALSEALSIYENTGSTIDAIGTRRDLAAVYAAMGRLQLALTELRRAERQAAVAGAGTGLRADLALTRAELSLELNAPAEAEREYARAERLFRAAGNAHGRAEAQNGRGRLLLLREDYAGARRMFESAARAQADGGDQRSAALTHLLVGYVNARRGDTAAAREAFTHAEAALRALGDPVGEAAALAALGDLEVQRGLTITAESLYTRGLTRLRARRTPNVAWHLHAGLGEALRSRGALADAARELRSAIGEIERVAGSLRLEERRAGFLADKWDVYAQLALVERARGRTGEAFDVSERMRARQMLDLVARGRVALARGAGDTLSAREQDLRRRIAELTRVVAGSPAAGASLRGSDRPAWSMDAAREALDAAHKAYTDFLLEARDARPEYARLVTGESVSWREVVRRLSPHEALLEYLVTDSTSVVFVVTSGGVTAVDLGIDRETLFGLVDFAMGTMTRPPRASGASNGMWRAALRRLYRQLVEPVERAGVLGGRRALLIAPHGALHYLPFAALIASDDREEFLVERYQISYIPSASLWIKLRDDRPAAPPNGVLALAPRPVALPASRVEAEAIGRLYAPRAAVLIGSSASERALREVASDQAVLHLATYGVFNRHNPLFSFVELAAGRGEDGRLEVHEVFGLSLKARLVVLSACRTALGAGTLADVPAGDDWTGLIGAFLFAGAESVVATLWPVEDRATARLMERFHSRLARGVSGVEALAQAQREAIRRPATFHPFYWAAFMLAGRR